MLTVNNLSCSLGGQVLFSNLGFSLGKNSILVIKGANGCGKTTLLETIACLKKPHEGAVLYNGQDARQHFHEYCSIIEYIGHKMAIKMPLTVLQNISFWAEIKGNLSVLPAALACLGLTNYKDTVCSKLSAGYQKRVALAKLIVSDASIWLLDEAFVHLDDESSITLANLITAKCTSGGTVIITTHGEIPLNNYVRIDLGDYNI